MSRRHFVNALTFSRAPLIFAWLVCAILQEFLGGWTLAIAACLMMLLSGLTDAWDGALARKWSVVSTLGKMADPLMDKVFYIVCFPALVWQAMHQGESDLHALILLGLTILYMIRDTWVTFMRSIGAMYGADVAAMYLGKVRTAISFPGAGWIYMYLAFHQFAPQGWVCLWLKSCYVVEGVLIFLTMWSLCSYTKNYSPYLKKALEHKEDL